MPFTPFNVMRVVREVEKWWGGIKSESLANFLYIPESKQEEIRQKFPDEIKQKKQSISYLINTDPLAGWRRLITALDKMKQSQLADSVRPNAEPLAGTCSINFSMYIQTCRFLYSLLLDVSLNPHTLLHSLSTVRGFWSSGLLDWLGVPDPVQDEIQSSSSYSSEDEKRIAILQYSLQTLPGMSWGRIAGVLWRLEEHTALETVRQYLPHKPG